jgi:hypothetical protein
MWKKKPKNPFAATKPKKLKDSNVLGEITRPSSASSTLKIGNPTIRVGLDAAKKAPKQIKVSTPKQPKQIKIQKGQVGPMI